MEETTTMKTEYRTPSIDEFVQGFEFEVVDWTTPTGIFIDGELIKLDLPQNWVPTRVTWMADPNAIISTKVGDLNVHVRGSLNNFFKPFNVEAYLKQGLIRVKNK